MVSDSTGGPLLQIEFGMRCWCSIPSPALLYTVGLAVGMGESGGSIIGVRLLQTFMFHTHFGEQSNSSAVRGHSPLGQLQRSFLAAPYLAEEL